MELEIYINMFIRSIRRLYLRCVGLLLLLILECFQHLTASRRNVQFNCRRQPTHRSLYLASQY